jgi:hypothetical protein
MSSGVVPSRSEDSTTSKKDNGGVTNVRRAFRQFASALVVAVRQAEVVAASIDTNSGKSTREQSATGNDPSKDRLDEALHAVGLQRQTLRKTATVLEAQLRGNVKESEALYCCLKSTPCVDGRKRKFSLLTTHDEGEESESI